MNSVMNNYNFVVHGRFFQRTTVVSFFLYVKMGISKNINNSFLHNGFVQKAVFGLHMKDCSEGLYINK